MFKPALLVAFAAALATPAPSQDLRPEGYLLNATVDAGLFGKVRIWDPPSSSWRPLRTGEGVREQTPLLVVNFWATWCKPCMQELPVLWDLARKEDARGDVKFVFLADPQSTQLKGFFEKSKGLLPPRAAQLEDTNKLVLNSLRERLPERLRAVGLPVTLILDEERVVRQAFVGDMTARREELSAALERLRQSARAHSPPEAGAPVEAALLHHRLDSGALRQLRVQPREGGAARPLTAAEVPGDKAPLVLLYLFAESTPQWRDDLPWLRDLGARLVQEGKDARLVVVEAGEGSGEALAKLGGALPLYQDSLLGLSESLRAGLPQGRLPLPVLLVLDQEQVVRQAFAGGPTDRRDLVLEALERLRQLRRKR